MKRLFLFLSLVLLGLQLSARTVRVLGIGNSFSVDALEQYLHELAQAQGDTIVVGNLYIGGCSLARHVDNCRKNAPAYLYTKILANGTKVRRDSVAISTALSDDRWTHISVQQASPNSGQLGTYLASLPELLAYVRGRMPWDAKIVLHQTWAYQGQSNHPDFKNYHRDQMEMYCAIVEASRRAAEICRINMIIPSGTAIQNMRTTSVGDHLDRDGYHLSYQLGRYTASCVWLEKLTGKSSVGNTFIPEGLSPELANIAQRAAHAAVLMPYAITSIDY